MTTTDPESTGPGTELMNRPETGRGRPQRIEPKFVTGGIKPR
jgi:hypothetical protein